MFHYIPKNFIKKQILKFRKNYSFDKEYKCIQSIIKKCTHQQYACFKLNYLNTSFYNPVKLDKIPVCGFLFPNRII